MTAATGGLHSRSAARAWPCRGHCCKKMPTVRGVGGGRSAQAVFVATLIDPPCPPICPLHPLLRLPGHARHPLIRPPPPHRALPSWAPLLAPQSPSPSRFRCSYATSLARAANCPRDTSKTISQVSALLARASVPPPTPTLAVPFRWLPRSHRYCESRLMVAVVGATAVARGSVTTASARGSAAAASTRGL